MRTRLVFIIITIQCVTPPVRGQGTFLVDQTSVPTNIVEGSSIALGLQPLGQSFTPTFSSVGFIQLTLSGNFNPNLGAVIYVNLRSNSITGTILDSTAPVVFSSAPFAGIVDFFFTNAVPVTPRVTYYFQPVVRQSGGCAVLSGAYNYQGGNAFISGVAYDGVANPNSVDLWFQEGVVVPEPSSVVLLLVGLGVFGCCRRKKACGRR